MIKIEGTHKISQHVAIEVYTDDFINVLETELGWKDRYVRDGKLYEYEYTHPHNGDEHFEEVRNATKEEIEEYSAFITVSKVLRKKMK